MQTEYDALFPPTLTTHKNLIYNSFPLYIILSKLKNIPGTVDLTQELHQPIP